MLDEHPSLLFAPPGNNWDGGPCCDLRPGEVEAKIPGQIP